MCTNFFSKLNVYLGLVTDFAGKYKERMNKKSFKELDLKKGLAHFME